jgi:hypothetical protein
VGSTVDDNVPVRRPAALVASFIDHLRVHCRTDASLNVLAFGLAHPAEHEVSRTPSPLSQLSQARFPKWNVIWAVTAA